jgi:PAS domain S-box-containing protein
LAAASTFRFLRPGSFHRGWALISVSLILQALFSAFTGFELVRSGQALPPALWLILSFSALFSTGILTLRRSTGETVAPVSGSAASPRGGSVSRLEDTAQFLESADLWINTLDLEARITFWNTTAETISGYQAAEVTGNSEIWAWLYPDAAYRAEVSAKVGNILQRDEIVKDFETTIRTKNGGIRIIAWWSRTLKDPEGRISGSLAIGRDLTFSRESEATLRRVNAWQNLILEHNVLGLAFVQDRHLVWANPRAAELWGVSLQDYIGASARILYPDDALYEEVGRKAYTIMARGGVFDQRLRLRRVNGQYFWCRLAGMVVDAAHPHGGSVWLAEDISKQVEDEAALSESEARFRGAFEGTQDALLLLTQDGIFDCNQRAVELFGFSHKSEMFQLHPADLSPAKQPDGEDSRKMALSLIQTALREGTARFSWEHRRQDGARFMGEVLLSAFTMGRRKVIQSCVRDIQDQLAVKASLRDSEERFRLLFERYADPLLLLDARSGQFVSYNQAALDILRCSREELSGLQPADLFPAFQPDGSPSLQKGVEMVRLALRQGSHRFPWIHCSPHREDFAVEVLMTVIQPKPSPLIFATWRELPGGFLGEGVQVPPT